MPSHNQPTGNGAETQAGGELFRLEDIAVHFDSSSNIINSLLQSIRGNKAKIRAVDGVDLTLHPNEVQGVIGESGCGKSTLLKSMVGLEDPTSGEMYFEKQPLSEFSKADWRAFRRDVQMIFQDPFNSLDPKYTVSEVLSEQLKIHDMEDARERKLEILNQVRLKPPEHYLDKYPEELSGGEKQRVSIARALIVSPKVLLADEPVSMLDVSTQASILRLLSEIIASRDMGMVYISHDISTVSYICDSINVMYLGRIVESALTERVLEDPKHPYTKALIQAVPIPDPRNTRKRVAIDGEVPDPLDMPSGCRFKDRCPDRMDICDKAPRDITLDDSDHTVACHLYSDRRTH